MFKKKKIIKYIDLFDAIEYSFFYTKHINFNKKSVTIHKKYNKPLIGASDMHHLWQMGYTYSLVDSRKNISSIFQAIKSNKIVLKTRALPYYRFIVAGIGAVYGVFRKY